MRLLSSFQPSGQVTDVRSHVQGIITNDPNLLQKESKDVIYTAFLNAQGRFLHDAFLYATGKASLKMAIKTHLRYRESLTCPTAVASSPTRCACAGEPFGILADVDKAHMPALMRLLRM